MDYNFTNDNDTIIATNENGFERGDRVFAGGGDDHVTIGSGIAYVSEVGNDTIVAQTGGVLAFWFDPGPSEINLATGTVSDAYGGIDAVSGITELHLSGFGANIIGSDLDENVFYFGGDSDIDLGGGDGDTLIMYQKTSDRYQLEAVNGGLRLTGEGNSLFLRGVEQIEFSDRKVNTEIVGSTLYAEFRSDAWTFIETEIAPGYTYAGVYSDPKVVSHFVQEAKVLDLDGDGDLDFFANMSKGYRANIDTRAHFVVLENRDGKLVYSQAMSEMTPFITGSRRIELLELTGRDTPVMVSVAHDTAAEGETRFDIPWRLGDIAVIGTQPFEDLTAQVIPKGQLPHVNKTGRDTSVDAHSLATGDVNGDGLEDIVVGDLSAGPFVLLQTASGTFTFEQPDFFKRLEMNWFEPTFADATEALLLDLHMADLNGDGFNDLVAGWGHAKVLGRIFFNDGSGAFSLQDSTTLPVAVYGNDNALHMATRSADFDQDGDLDLVILQARYEPFYSGNYLQFLENDGSGNFTDRTAQRFGDPTDQPDTFASRLMWTDNWQVIDVNGDGFLDILGHDVSGSQTPLLWLNLGNGAFTRLDIPTNPDTGRPLQWADFDGDGALEFVSFDTSWTDETGTASTNRLSVYELAASAFDGQSHQLGQTEGDDVLQTTSQNDLIDGMGGADTAVFSNASTGTTLRIKADGSLIVIDREGTGGTDSLRNVETLQFSDRALEIGSFSRAIQLNQAEFMQLAEMYVAYFNRAPDAEGLLYWADKYAGGLPLDQIAEFFFDQEELRNIYTDPSDTDTFITAVYTNVLGRAPDSGGFAYWMEKLENNAFTEGAFVLQIINGAKNNLAAQTDVAYLATKAKLGVDFAGLKGMGDVVDAISVMTAFGEQDTSDLAAARNMIENHYLNALTAESDDFLIQTVGVVDDPFSVN